ncbi:MAG TPA: AAA family ATPase, partial [Candidatus Hydrogenedentes bacterium]|nr:AAA family ATPase [Candidatus Hydrogenedentota bacterium]
STGRKVDFRNTVIVMTSNVGARRIGRSTQVGFNRASTDDEYKEMKSRVMEEIKKVFNPEFLNRVDELVVFHRLAPTDLTRIVDIHVAEVIERVGEKGYDLFLSDEAKDFVVRVGSDEQYGARPLRRAVQQYVEDPLSEALLKGAFAPGMRIEVRPSDQDDALVFEPAVPIAEGITN